MYKCCVVIPVYKQPDTNELESIKQTIKILGNTYDIYLLMPNNFNDFGDLLSLHNFNIIRFPYYYFINNITYSVLLESPIYWESFSKYEWMMIIQTDAWIFKNDIPYFINLNYDYYGAPWLFYIWGEKDNTKTIGNGGFSLRKISKMLAITKKFGPQIVDYNIKTPGANLSLGCIYEDVYFCIEHKNMLNICPFEIGVKFAIDEDYINMYRLNNNILPMGCHRYVAHSEWWSQFIPIYISNPSIQQSEQVDS